MKPSELFEALHALIAERVPLHIWGAGGVGKSQIVAQVAAVHISIWTAVKHDRKVSRDIAN
jgi:MoxR-like ATPase